MKVRKWKGLWGALAIAFPALVVVVAQSPASVFADDEVEVAEGRITELSPNRGGSDDAVEEQAEEAEVAAPKYWIGLQGRPIDNRVLRTQLQLAGDVGVAIESVMPDSPAEKAGLRQDDILVAVDGEPLADLQYLQSVVAEKHDKPIELKVLRLAKEEVIKVTPEEIPAEVLERLAVQQQRQDPTGMLQGGNFDPQALMEQLRQQGGQGGMRMIGPGMIFGGQSDQAAQVPNGVSVNVTRNGDGPATITVKKGDKTWTVEGEDEEALAKLPEDVRPFVDQLLNREQANFGGLPGFNLQELQNAIPGDLRQFDAGGAADNVDRMNQRLLERMERLEQRIQELQEEQNGAPAEKPQAEKDPSA
jgi:membrane-associated protease RseP (regulator of RpoE activity)